MAVNAGSTLKNALRTLRASPILTLMCILALALGIGANTAVFSVLDAVLLRPLPYPEPDRLVSVAADLRALNIRDAGISIPEYEDLRDRAGIFDGISFVWPMDGNLTGVTQPVRVEALAVGANYFDLLGGKAALGRTFRQTDVRPGVSEAVVLSYGVWQRLFHGDRKVLGRKIYLDYDTFVVIGVMPPGFRHPGSTLQGDVEFWITGGFGGPPWGGIDRRTQRRLPRAIARVKHGITVDQARSRLDAFTASLRREYPGDYPAASGWAPRVTELQKELAGTNNTRLLLLMLGAVGLVLLICCATVANLLLAKAVTRDKEFAVRSSLGASPGRLLAQLGTEGLLLAAAGAVCGLVVSIWLIPVLLELAPLNLPRVNRVGVNAPLLAFTMIAGVLAAVLSSFAPVLQVFRFDLVSSLRRTATGSGTSASRHHLQGLLVAGQIAFSLVLMVGAGLLLRSFWSLMQVDPGFSAKNVTIASIWLPPPMNPQADRRYLNPDRRRSFVREVLSKVQVLPGVEAVAMGGGDSIPLAGWNIGAFMLEDAGVANGQQLSASMTSVSPDFFKVLRIPLIQGRVFTESDDGEYRVCLIDRAMVRRFFRDREPIGRKILTGGGRSGAQAWTVVGVVGDIKTESFDTPDAPHIYYPIYQRSDLALTVFLRATANPAGLAEALRRTIQSADSDLPVFGVRTMGEVISRSVAQRRFALEVIGLLAILALTLSLMGIYGVTAFTVGERRREIGIRMALGARPGQVLGMILGGGMRIAAAGLALGLVGASILARFLESLLYDATPADPLTYFAVSGVLLAATLAACLVPAARATKVDPSGALRAD